MWVGDKNRNTTRNKEFTALLATAKIEGDNHHCLKNKSTFSFIVYIYYIYITHRKMMGEIFCLFKNNQPSPGDLKVCIRRCCCCFCCSITRILVHLIFIHPCCFNLYPTTQNRNKSTNKILFITLEAKVGELRSFSSVYCYLLHYNAVLFFQLCFL